MVLVWQGHCLISTHDSRDDLSVTNTHDLSDLNPIIPSDTVLQATLKAKYFDLSSAQIREKFNNLQI
jgi:hypothetical protein